MLTLPLDPTDDKGKPAFKDAAGCMTWLGQLQLTNLQRAHSQLLVQMNELNRNNIRGIDRLSILETIRETVGYVQNDYAKKLVAKALPLSEGELMVFVGIVHLWQAMLLSYQRCLQAYIGQEPTLSKYGALLCQRCLSYGGLQIFEHLRTGYEFDPKLWYQLHAMYAFCESQNLHLIEVPDSLNEHHPKMTARGVYLKSLLACYARPAELSRSQLQCLDRWLSSWVSDITIESQCSVSKGDASPLALNFASTQGLQPMQNVQPGGYTRFLPMVPLSKLLRVKIILLQQGQTPQQVELGDFVGRNDCINLLTFLHQCWCENRNVRNSERRSVAVAALLTSKIEAIYAHFAGHSFAEPDFEAAREAARKPKKKGDELQPVLDDLPEMEFPLEEWHIENESLLGAKLARPELFGIRLNCGQLIALRPNDAKMFMLGVAAWLTVTATGKLSMGVRYFPSLAEPVSIRLSGSNIPPPNKYIPALLLQAVPALKAPATLIIPRELFQADRVLEVVHPNYEVQKFKLTNAMERGFDYERVLFEIVG